MNFESSNDRDSSVIITQDWRSAARILASRTRDIASFYDCRLPDDHTDLRKILNALPITDKSFYQKQKSMAYLEHARSVLLLAETSGSTGSAPLFTPRGRTDFTWNTYNQSLAYRYHIVPGWDRVMLLNPSVMSPFIEGSSRALYDLGVAYMRAFPIPKVCNWERLGRLINDYGITAIVSTPTLLMKTFFELERLNIEVPTLKKLLVTGEHIPGPLLNALDNILGVPGATRPLVYGSSEAASLMHGRQDGDYSGFLRDFVFEILPIKTGWADTFKKTLPDSATFGHLLVSWLRDGIMTLVRYDTKDLFSCWYEEKEDEYIFRSHGRALPNSLTPDIINKIEMAVWDGPTTCGNVVYFEMYCKESSCLLNVITRVNGTRIDAKILAEDISDIIKKEVSVVLNPENHDFYDFSPPTKRHRFLCEDLNERKSTPYRHY